MEIGSGVGQAVRINCPYRWCDLELDLIDTGDNPQQFTVEFLQGAELENLSSLIIPRHVIGNHILVGVCPAALMHYPIRPNSRHQEILNECANADYDKIVSWVAAMVARPHDPRQRPVSQSLRGPHRMTREPPPKSKDWQLKGREDEDIQPDALWHAAPRGVHGEGIGKVSVQETLDAINGAAIKIGEALATVDMDNSQNLAGAIVSVEEGRSMVQGAKGQVQSETLNAYIGSMLEAEEELRKAVAAYEQATQHLHAALHLGEQYANIVHG